ncbi:MAG: hypothetical protein JO266_22430 [Acidobacteria bacterium]|nr:hypothetical protein [Acidobacteriota bacterium]
MSFKTLIAVLAAGLFTLPAFAVRGARPSSSAKPVEVLADQAAVMKHFRALGFLAHGGVEKGASERIRSEGRTFPTFSSSFTVGGVTYPFTMIGHPPASGRAAFIKSVIIPLRMNFVGFGNDHSFDPNPAVTNIVNSPLYVPTSWPGDLYGQFVESMQRAAFWNLMDREHEWRVRMDRPRILTTVDVEVTPQTGTLQLDNNNNPLFGDVLFDFMDSQIQTILQLLDLDDHTLPIFVTDGVTNQALGYHNAALISDDGGNAHLQTYIFTSWLDPALVPPIFADVSTFNHELAEWTNDPFINNVVPTWMFPPQSDPAATCSGNNLLEVGDPQGNGPTFADFPQANVSIGGVTYHLQQLVLWQWFADQVPSSAFGGWFTFPIPQDLKVPAVYCP